MRSKSHTALTTRTIILVTLFVLSPIAWSRTKYRVLHNFGASGDGTIPSGPPVLDSRGNLFGVTDDGGAGTKCSLGCGTVFELTHQANGRWVETLLHDFTGGGDGSGPWGGLVFDGAGNLYGTIVGDPGLDAGGVFELRPSSHDWSNTVIYTDGAGPGLLTDKLGNIYGAIGPGDYFGAGAIGELSHGSNGWVYTQLYSFCGANGCPDGYSPFAAPIWDRKGNLYGTTLYGGIVRKSSPVMRDSGVGFGVVFRMTANGDGTWTYHVLHRFGSFNGDGEGPAAGLVMDAAGNFYGNTVFGGPSGNGTIFKLEFSGGRWKESQLYGFPKCENGCLPSGTMVLDKAGNIYGVSSGGQPNCGGYTCGVVFKMTPVQKNGKWKYSVVHAFNGTDGDGPVGVIIDSKGRIFGMTSRGGTYNWGVAFEISP
jgi:uncharacterized repeat protein (TIGR03803 family)